MVLIPQAWDVYVHVQTTTNPVGTPYDPTGGETNQDKAFYKRMSEEDFAELDAQSVKTGVPKSEIIRRAWKHMHIAEMPSGDFLSMARELRKIGTNLNQLAKVANVRGNIETAKVRAALDDVIDIDRKIRQMIGGDNL